MPRARSTYGDRSFAVARPSIWNSLSSSCHTRSVTVQSRFQETAEDSSVWMTNAALVRLNWRLRNVFTYLVSYLLTYLLVVLNPLLFRSLLQETSTIGNVVLANRLPCLFVFHSVEVCSLHTFLTHECLYCCFCVFTATSLLIGCLEGQFWRVA